MSISNSDLGFEQELPGDVKNWSAQDFSNFFIRFRPQVERHAAKYLRDKSMVDEVVQEAFLYLMIALPELDSELGVLRFLKWKVRLLCLDVIRASKSNITGVDELLDGKIESDISEDLIRADDAAIIQLALSKIEPRQREALIASVYQEKSAAQISEQLGISENATRQLLLRARSSLKKALVGEADLEGLSLAEIISVAARKAAQESRKAGARAMGILLVLGLASVAIYTGQVSPISGTQNIASEAPSVVAEQPSEAEAAAPTREPEQLPAAPSNTEIPSGTEAPPALLVEDKPLAEPEQVTNSETLPASGNSEVLLASQETIDRSPFDPWLVDGLFEDTYSVEFTRLSSDSTSSSSSSRNIYTVAVSAGIWADIAFDPIAPNPFTNVRIGFIAGTDQYFADLEARDFLVDQDGPFETFRFVGHVAEIFDVQGEAYEGSRMSGTVFEVTVTFDPTINEVVGLSLNRSDQL